MKRIKRFFIIFFLLLTGYTLNVLLREVIYLTQTIKYTNCMVEAHRSKINNNCLNSFRYGKIESIIDFRFGFDSVYQSKIGDVLINNAYYESKEVGEIEDE